MPKKIYDRTDASDRHNLAVVFESMAEKLGAWEGHDPSLTHRTLYKIVMNDLRAIATTPFPKPIPEQHIPGTIPWHKTPADPHIDQFKIRVLDNSGVRAERTVAIRGPVTFIVQRFETEWRRAIRMAQCAIELEIS